MARPDVNWPKVEADYRAGILSVREIARECAISESLIRKRAKDRGWERDLTEEVRAKTRQMMVRSLAKAQEDAQGQRAQTAEETIEKAALTQMGVVRDHQVSIHDAYSLTRRLLDELDSTTSHQGEMENMITAVYDDAKQRKAALRAVSLPGRAAVMRDLATAAKTWVGLERQAFGIVEEKEKPPAVAANLSIDELRAQILADIADLGLVPANLALPPPGASEGVANRPRKTEH